MIIHLSLEIKDSEASFNNLSFNSISNLLSISKLLSTNSNPNISSLLNSNRLLSTNSSTNNKIKCLWLNSNSKCLLSNISNTRSNLLKVSMLQCNLLNSNMGTLPLRTNSTTLEAPQCPFFRENN
jgi:hypothetical protein